MAWHLNYKKEPAACKASSPEACPRGGQHYNTRGEAVDAAEAIAKDAASNDSAKPGGNALSKTAGGVPVTTASTGASAGTAAGRTEAMAALAVAGVEGIDGSALEDEDVTVLTSAYATEEVMLVKNPRNGKWSICGTRRRFDTTDPSSRTVRTRLRIDLSDDVNKSAVTDENAKRRVAWLQAVSRQRKLRKEMDLKQRVAPVTMPIDPSNESVRYLTALTDGKNVADMIARNPEVRPEHFTDRAKFYSTLGRGEMPDSLPETMTWSEKPNCLTSGYADDLVHRAGLYMQTGLGAYVTPTKANARALAEAVGPDGVVLDPLAGRGWSGKMLRSRGVPTIMSDDKSWSTASNDAVEDLDAIDSVSRHAAACTHVLISWAPGDGLSRDAGGGSAIDWKVMRETLEANPSAKFIMIAQPYERDADGWRGKVGSGKARSVTDDRWRPAEARDWKVTSVPYEDAHQLTECWLIDPTPHWKHGDE